MKLFLHCGAHKTATTLIQAMLARAADQLRGSGIGYIDPASINQAGVIRFNHSRQPKEAEFDTVSRFFQSFFDRWKLDTYLISHESFFSFANLNGQPRQRQFYGDMSHSAPRFAQLGLFDEIHIIFYIRRQDGFLNSVYLEYLKGGYLDIEFEQFLGGIDLERICWKRVVDVLEDSFGREKVVLRLFDDIRAGAMSYLQGFLEAIGVGDEVVIDGVEEKNRSFSAVAYQMAMRCYPLLNLAERRKLARFLQLHFSNRDYPAARLVSEELKTRLHEMHGEKNLRLFRSYFPKYSEETEFATV